jgi:transmembrane sensor
MTERRPESARARAEAASWFTQLGRSAVTTDQLREFRDWRSSAANAEAYARLEATWSRAGDLRRDPDILAATAAAFDRRSPGNRLRQILQAPSPWATAGIGTALVALSALGLLRLGAFDPAYATGVGEQRTVRLEDGSRVALNTDTRLKVRYSPEGRTIQLLRGQAFFDVAHDPARPFVVEAGGTQVRALGTRFDVRREAEALQVTLAEGSVQVTPDRSRQAWVLRPDQQLTLTAAGQVSTRAAEADTEASWTTGRLIFEATPLAEAAAEVSRYGDAVTVDPALAGRPVSGVFHTGDTQAFVAAVSQLFELEARKDDRGAVRLEPAGA